MKDILFVFAILIAAGATAIVIRYNQETKVIKQTLEQERYNRLEVEELSQKNLARIRNLEAELKASQAKIDKAQELIDQQKNVNADLKSQYEKLTQAKQELEEKLQATLTEASAAPVATQ